MPTKTTGSSFFKRRSFRIAAIAVGLVGIGYILVYNFGPRTEVNGTVIGVDFYSKDESISRGGSDLPGHLPDRDWSNVTVLSSSGNFYPLMLCGDQRKMTSHIVHLVLRPRDKCMHVSTYDDLGQTDRVKQYKRVTVTNLGPTPSVQTSLASSFSGWAVWNLGGSKDGAACKFLKHVNVTGRYGKLDVTIGSYTDGFSFEHLITRADEDTPFGHPRVLEPEKSSLATPYLALEIADASSEEAKFNSVASGMLLESARKEGWKTYSSILDLRKQIETLKDAGHNGSDTLLLASTDNIPDCQRLAGSFGSPHWLPKPNVEIPQTSSVIKPDTTTQ